MAHTKKTGQARQGDVFSHARIAKLPKGVTPRARVNGRVVLAEGEVTGHLHQMDIPESTQLWNAPPEEEKAMAEQGLWVAYLVVDEVSRLIHDEHNPIPRAPGVYRVQGQREYSPEELRSVAD